MIDGILDILTKTQYSFLFIVLATKATLSIFFVCSPSFEKIMIYRIKKLRTCVEEARQKITYYCQQALILVDCNKYDQDFTSSTVLPNERLIFLLILF